MVLVTHKKPQLQGTLKNYKQFIKQLRVVPGAAPKSKTTTVQDVGLAGCLAEN